MQLGDTARPQGTWQPPAFWLILAALAALAGIGTNLLEIRYSYFAQEQAGTWGFSSQFNLNHSIVTSVEPGSMAAAKGIQAGDQVQTSAYYGPNNVPLVGEKLQVTRLAPLPRKDFTLTATRADPAPMAVPDPLDRAIDDFVRVLLLLGGGVILWRGWHRRSSFLLGIVLIGASCFPPIWLPLGPDAYAFWKLVEISGNWSGNYILAAFAMAYVAEIGVRVSPWMKAVLAISLLNFASIVLFSAVIPQFAPDWFVSDLARQLRQGVLNQLPTVLAFIVLLHGWRCGSAQSRHRTALLLMAVPILTFGNTLFGIFFISVQSQGSPRLLTDTSSVTRIIGIVLFAYAILRHRVIDIGFTINRTLVYGSVSLILLATFGLLEWGMHHLLEIEGKESSPLIDAGLAVSIFLAFHPLRDFVEQYVERWFFSSWQKAETQLKRFVSSAGHFNTRQVLCGAFAKELSHYAEGAEAALYMARSGGVYRLTAGSLTGADEHYEENPAFALMRAERKPIGLTHGEATLPGALALPMLDQGVLTGFALLAAKPDGSYYRPDELENLEWAAHQVGLDLQALRARELEERVAKLTKENTSLNEKNGLLMALLDKARLADEAKI